MNSVLKAPFATTVGGLVMLSGLAVGCDEHRGRAATLAPTRPEDVLVSTPSSYEPLGDSRFVQAGPNSISKPATALPATPSRGINIYDYISPEDLHATEMERYLKMKDLPPWAHRVRMNRLRQQTAQSVQEWRDAVQMQVELEDPNSKHSRGLSNPFP